MKKISLVLAVIIIALMLVGCNNTPVYPAREMRWDSTEEFKYTVTGVKDKSYYNVNEVPGALVVPSDSNGSYTMKVNSVDISALKITNAETYLDIWNKYSKEKTGNYDMIPEEYVRNVEGDENSIEFRTTVKVNVEFPLYKCNSVRIESKGAVVVVDGENSYHTEFNDYVAECKDFSSDNAKYIITYNNGAYPNKDGTISTKSLTEYTDNTSLLYIIRSMDMDKLKSAGSTSLSVTDIVYGSSRNVTLTTSDNISSPAIKNIIGNDAEQNYTRIRISTGASIEGSSNYVYIDTNIGNEGNTVLGDSVDLCRNRIILMQQGYLIFQLEI